MKLLATLVVILSIFHITFCDESTQPSSTVSEDQNPVNDMIPTAEINATSTSDSILVADNSSSTPIVNEIPLNFTEEPAKPDEPIALRLGVVGRGNNTHNANVLLSLLRNPSPARLVEQQIPSQEQAYTHDVLSPSTVLLISEFDGKQPDVPYNDACVLFIDDKIILNEDVVLQLFLDSFRSLLQNRKSSLPPSPDRHRPPLVILFSGHVNPLVEVLLARAWRLLDVSSVGRRLSGNPLRELDVQIILVPPPGPSEAVKVGGAAVAAVDTVLAGLPSPRPLSACLAPPPAFPEPAPSQWASLSAAASSLARGSDRERSRGMAQCEAARRRALDWALSAANASVELLNRPQAGPLFGRFVADLQRQARRKLRVFLEEQRLREGPMAERPHPSALGLAERTLGEALFAALQPFHRRQVQLLRAQVAADLNRELTGEDEEDGPSSEPGEGLVVDAFVMRRLREATLRALKSFRRGARRLQPPGQAAPSSWSSQAEEGELAEGLRQLLEEREAAFRRQGILPRTARRPLELSLHLLLPHPLGLRDYRQDPLCLGEGDVPVSAAALQSPTLPARTARAALQRRVQGLEEGPSTGWPWSAASRQLRAARKQSEFSREMLMFPLSVKNPAVPMAVRGAGGRQSRPRTTRDPDWAALHGPERYIRWDLAPLDEVLANLQALQGQAEAPGLRQSLDAVLSSVPGLAKAYRHPPLSYGPAHAPSRR